MWGELRPRDPKGQEFARVQAKEKASGVACARLGQGASEPNPRGCVR